MQYMIMGRRTLLVLTAFIAVTCTPYSVVAETADDEASNQEEVLVAQIDVVLPSISKKKRTSSGEDLDERCAEWSAAGECEANPDYMLQNCAGSCSDDDTNEDDVDQPAMKGNAYVYSGEDAAVGAFRFAENYSSKSLYMTHIMVICMLTNYCSCLCLYDMLIL